MKIQQLYTSLKSAIKDSADAMLEDIPVHLVFSANGKAEVFPLSNASMNMPVVDKKLYLVSDDSRQKMNAKQLLSTLSTMMSNARRPDAKRWTVMMQMPGDADAVEARKAGLAYMYDRRTGEFCDSICIAVDEQAFAQCSGLSIQEKQKFRQVKKNFKKKGMKAFPSIKSDNDIVFVRDIPKDKALHLMKACHDVSNFHPEYMKKALKWSDGRVFGVFNKHDKRNVLALASVNDHTGLDGVAYLHEMTGFIKGGYGKKLVTKLLEEFGKMYGQVALLGDGTKSNPYKPNIDLRDKFYAKIPGMKIYTVEDSTWNCPADFFYYGIPESKIKDFLEKEYGTKQNEKED